MRSIPFGLVAILVITNLWPRENVENFLSWRAFTRIDFVGSATLICSSGLLVFALQQAGSQVYSWMSVPIVTALVVSAVTWVAFVWWEVILELKNMRGIDPIFPIRLMARRVYAAGLMYVPFGPHSSVAVVKPFQLAQIANLGQSHTPHGLPLRRLHHHSPGTFPDCQRSIGPRGRSTHSPIARGVCCGIFPRRCDIQQIE